MGKFSRVWSCIGKERGKTHGQRWQYGTVRRYDTVRLNFCLEVRYAGTVRFFCNGTGTVRWYGTLFSQRYGYGSLVRSLN